jgi:hypothetical protein
MEEKVILKSVKNFDLLIFLKQSLVPQKREKLYKTLK